MMRLRILIALGISLLLSLVMVLTLRFVAQQLQPPPPYVGTMIYPPEKLPDFALTDTNNATVGLDLYRGKLTLMAFGYTHCPDVCPMTLGDFRRVKTALGDSASEAQFVFITVDGERDTAEYLQSYMVRFDPSFIGITGQPDLVQTFGKTFGLYVAFRQNEASAANYLVDHTASMFLVDQQARLIRVYPFATPPNDIATDMVRVLQG